jgi:hypothetical protein
MQATGSADVQLGDRCNFESKFMQAYIYLTACMIMEVSG